MSSNHVFGRRGGNGSFGIDGVAQNRQEVDAGLVLGSQRTRALAMLAGLVASLHAPIALGGPEGAQVAAGSASIVRDGNTTLIRAADNTIINYSSFNIAGHETVRFLQPDAASKVLNRIQGAGPTRIDGSLLANGRVYIVNPAGVVFGQGATVNVGGLYAAAGQMSDRDFLAGVDRFSSLTGNVTNHGSISASANASGGTVVLAGSSVLNTGSIVAPEGTIALAAGQDVMVGERNGHVYTRVEGAAASVQDGAVRNTGRIDARRGQAFIAASDTMGLAINMGGSVRARKTTIAGKGDVVVSAAIDAKDQAMDRVVTPVRTVETTPRGGEVSISGERIAVVGARIDAGGQAGGGSVTIGRAQGDVGVGAAEAVALNNTTTIDASGVGNGGVGGAAGGSVIVWSDAFTNSHAAIVARGSGNGQGGFIETSSKGTLKVNGSRIDASSESGKAGRWLLDPRNIRIQSNPTSNGSFDAGTPDIFTPSGDDSIVDAGDIASRLNGGTDVTITTGSTGTQDGDITIEADIVRSSGTGRRTLRFEAANSIVMQPTVSIRDTSGGGGTNILLVANSGPSDPNTSAGAIALLGSTTLNSDGGDIFLGGGNASTAALGDIASDAFVTNLRASAARGTGSNASGVTIATGSNIIAGTGNVVIRGVGAASADSSTGVSVTSSIINGASVSIAGLGGEATGSLGNGNTGVRLEGVVVQSATGATTVQGRGGTTEAGTNTIGVHQLSGGVVGGAGTVTVSGLGGTGTGTGNTGVLLGTNSVVLASGDNPASLTGVARGSGASSHGVQLAGGRLTTSTVPATTVNTNLTISGTSGTGASSQGIELSSGAVVSNTNASVSLIGTSRGSGADSSGLVVVGSSSVTGGTNSGVGITAIANDVASASLRTDGSTVTVDGGTLLVAADRVELGASTTIQGQNSATASVRASSPDTTLGLGTGSTGTLNLSDSELASFAGFSRLQFGASGGGAISTAGLNFTTQNADIVLRGASLSTAGITMAGSRTLTLNIAGATSQTGAIVADVLELRGGTGTFALNGAANSIGTLAANASSVSLTDSGSLTIGSAGTTTGLTLASGSSLITTADTLTVSNAINVGTSVLELRAGDLALNANVLGTGSIAFANSDVAGGMVINSDAGFDNAGFVDIEADELARIGSTLTGLTFGRSDGTGLLRVQRATTFASDTSGQAALLMGGTGGRVDIEAPIRGQNMDVRIASGQLTRFNGAVVTNGRAITIEGASQLVTNTLLDATDGGASAGGNISIGSLEADAAANGRIFTVRAGTGAFVANGAIGATEALANTDISGASNTVRSVRTLGNQAYAGSTFINGALQSTGGGRLDVNGGVGVSGDSTMEFASGVRITGGSVSPTPSSLSISASNGLIELPGMSGFGNLTFTSNSGNTGTGIVAFGDIAGAAVRFVGPLSLAQSVANQTTTITGGTSVLFEGTVESDSAVALSVASPLTTFSQLVGGNSRVLRALTTDAAGTTTLLANVTTTGDQTYNDRLLLGTDVSFTSASGGVSFVGGADSDGGTPRTMSISAPGGTRLGGNIGGQSPLASISVDSGTPVTLAGAISTTLAQNYAGPVLVGGTTTLTAPTVVFGGTVNGTGTGDTGLTVVATNDASFNAGVGLTQVLSSIDVSAASIIMNEVRTSGAQRYNGPTRLRGNLTSTNAGSMRFTNEVVLETDVTIASAGLLDSDDIVFSGRVDSLSQSNGSGRNLVVNAGLGDVAFSGDLGVQTTGGLTQLASLDVTGATITALVVRSQGSQFYNGNTTLTGNLTTTGAGSIALSGDTILTNDITVSTNAGDVIFGGLLNSDTSAARNLVVNSGGNGITRFGGAVGENGRLATLTTNADGRTRIEGGVVRTTGDQVYGDSVTLASNTLLEGNDVFFTGTLDSDGRNTPRNLTVNSSASGADTGETTFNAAVGGTFRLGSITTNAEGQTRINGDVQTTRTQTYGDQVLVQRSLTLNSGNGGLFFRQTIDADGSATDPTLTLVSNANGVLDEINYRFGGNIGQSRRLGGITIGVDRAPTWASNVVFSDAWDTQGRVATSGVTDADAFTVTTGAAGITVGTGNKILAFGSLTLNSTGAIQFGDVNALRNLNVTSADIRLAQRLPGEVQDRTIQTPRDQVVREPGADLIAGGTIDFSSRPTLIGVGAAPTVNAGSGRDPELSGLLFRTREDPINNATFADPRITAGGILLPFDLVAQGASSTAIGNLVYDGERPSAVFAATGLNPLMPRVPGAATGESLAAALQTLGLAAGVPSSEVRLRGLSGASMADALPDSVGPTALALRDAGTPKLVNLTRVHAPSLLSASSTYATLTGNEAALLAMRNTLNDSWERYTKRSMKPTGGGWRASLESQTPANVNEPARVTAARKASGETTIAANPGDVEALAHLNTLREFFAQLQDSGLSAGEALVPARALLAQVKPEAMNERDLQAAINGWMATYVLAE
jgi:filamentous hemagglutinin family protein